LRARTVSEVDMRTMMEWFDRLTPWQAAGIGLLLAFVLEVVTVAMRFGLGLQTTRDTAWLSPLTLGFRIHHGYFGVLLLLACPFLRCGPRNALLAVGLALLVSDLVHHFVVLKGVTGDAQFHLRYPGSRQ